MPSLYSIERVRQADTFPVIAATPGGVNNLFLLDQDHSLGTTSLENQVTRIVLSESGASFEPVIVQDQIHVGTYSFTQPWSEEAVCFSQSRAFCRLKPNEKVLLRKLATDSLDDIIEKTALIDKGSGLFILEMLHVKGIGYEKQLVPVSWDGDILQVGSRFTIGEKGLAYDEPWCVNGGKVLSYSLQGREIRALDQTLRASSHPLASLFADKKERFRQVDQICIHPELPFAIIADFAFGSRKQYIYWLASWQGDDFDVVPLFDNRESDGANLVLTGLEFSPDGRFLAFQNRTDDPKRPDNVILPVAKSYPFVIGPPIILGPVLNPGRTQVCSSWVHRPDPVRFVASDGDALYVWTLRNPFDR